MAIEVFRDTKGKKEGPNQERTLLEALLHYLSIALRYRWLIIAVTAVAALAVVAFCVVSVRLPPEKSPLPNKYTASAIILVQKAPETDLSSAIRTALGIVTNQADQQTGFDNGAFLLMVLQSRTFLDKIGEEFGVDRKYGIPPQHKSRLRKILLGNLRFQNNPATASITISYTDIDPVFARNITNRMVALLSEWYSENMGSSKQQQRRLLEEKIAEVKAYIEKLVARQDELQKKYGALTAQDLGASQASALAALRSQLILKEIDIKNYANVSSAEDPKMQQLQEERQNIVNQISRMQQGMPATSDSTASRTSLPDVQTEFNNLTLELDVQRKIDSTLSHQYEVLKLTSDTEPPFQVMELAETPDAKSGPQRTSIIVEVVAIAFVVSLALAFLLNGISQLRRGQQKGIPARRGG
jgi:tyrosine-protein kinase Etk/Wzc